MTAAAIWDCVEQLQAAVSDFLKHAGAGGFGVLSDGEFGEVAGEVEAIRRQLATGDYPIVAEVQGESGGVLRRPGRAAGAAVTVAVTMTAFTSLGHPIRVSQALRMADQAALAWLVHDSRGSVLAHGRTRRLATRAQADALAVRDGGCAFPGCDHPPDCCQRHHIREWRAGGTTDLDNLVLLCSYHHHRFAAQGWQIRMRDGVP